MDPISALLLALALSGLVVNTGSAAVGDTIAKARGRTPPSEKKFQQTQQSRTQRGQQPQQDPGPWKRRWRNAAEARTVKASQKHAARMERLHETADDTKQRHKDRLARRAQRREQVGTILAGWGQTSWEATKQATTRARNGAAERRAEKRAWPENARRDSDPGGTESAVEPAEHADPADTADTDVADDSGGAEGEGAPVLEVRPHGRDGVEVIPNGENPSNVRGDHRDPSTWTGTDRYGRDIQTGRDPRRTITAPDGSEAVVHDDDTYLLGADVSPERRIVVETARNHRDDQPAAATGNTDNHEGNTTMSAPAHSGEITDLPSAIAYCTSTVQYCDQITGTFEDSQAQASAAAADLGQQLSALETAQSSLSGQGVDGAIQGHLSAMQERFASLVNQLQQAEQLLSATAEEIASARADADSAGKALQSQMGIAEEVQSQQANGVATNTDFYAHA